MFLTSSDFTTAEIRLKFLKNSLTASSPEITCSGTRVKNTQLPLHRILTIKGSSRKQGHLAMLSKN